MEALKWLKMLFKNAWRCLDMFMDYFGMLRDPYEGSAMVKGAD